MLALPYPGATLSGAVRSVAGILRLRGGGKQLHLCLGVP